MTSEICIDSITDKEISDLFEKAHRLDRENFKRMISLGYSNREACQVAILHSKLGKGEFGDREAITGWLDDVEETINLSKARELMRPGFPWRSGTTYHPLQEDKSNPSYYWN